MSALAHTPLLSLIVGAPLLAALLVLLLPDAAHRPIRGIALLGALASLAGSIAMLSAYDRTRGGLQLVERYPLVPQFGIELHFAADGWSVSLLLLTGIIISAGVLASFGVQDRPKAFFALLLVLVGGVFGVFVAQDLFVFFLFYEIAVLPMYLLIGIWGSTGHVQPRGPFAFAFRRFDVGGREYAAMKLTLMLLVGSAVILVAILAMYFAAGGSSFELAHLQAQRYPLALQRWAFPLLWLGFGSLAGVFPFHTWSPDGHAAAPTAVSMLHAGVLMKLGAFGVMRVGMLLLPEGARAWAPWVGGVAVINVLYGALCAMNQKDLKYVIAYSSVSHMGVVMLGAATLTIDGWNGAVYQMFAHGMMTGLFFALVGLIYARAHTRDMPSMGGFARSMPLTAALFILAGLSSLGMPGLAGFVAEFLVFLGAFQSDHRWWAIPAILGAWVTAVYVLNAGRTIFFGPGPAEKFHELTDPRRSEWGALLCLGACLILFGSYPRLILDFIHLATNEYLPRLMAAGSAVAVVTP